METIEASLLKHPFMRGIEPALIKEMVPCASFVTFNSGDFIARVDEEAHRFYLLLHGRVSIQTFSPKKGPITVQTLGEGEMLGRFWLKKPYRWRFEARAQELTRAIALDVKCLSEKCEANHSLGYAFMKRYTYGLVLQFRTLRLQLLDMLE